jgi:hypothetical protein
VLAALVAAVLGSTHPGLSRLGLVVVGMFAVDALGGVLTNATGSAKRWYHRPGTRRERLGFVASHVVHVVLIGLMALGWDWGWLALNAATLVVFAACIEYTPLPVRRAVAMGLLVAALLLNQLLVPVPAGLSWIPMVFYLKLLVSHLVPEAPFVSAAPRLP